MASKAAKPKMYRRSTPIGRVHRNVLKTRKHVGLVQSRLGSWETASDKRLVRAWELTSEIIRAADELDSLMGELEGENFIPPKRSAALTFIEGQTVRIVDKHRSKYELAFQSVLAKDPLALDSLTVVTLLPTGEVVVRRGHNSPFMVPKTHLASVQSVDEGVRKRGG